MAKAAREMRMCEGKTEHRETYKSQAPRITLWAIHRVAEPVWLSPLLNRGHVPPNVFIPEVISKLWRSRTDQWTSIRSVAPTRTGHRKGPVCVLLFPLLELSYISQIVA